MTAADLDLTAAPRIAEVVVTYARTIFDVRHCDTYTIGDSPRASFQLHAPLLPGPCFPLIRRGDDGAPELCFTRATAGEFIHAGRTTALVHRIDPHHPNPGGIHSVPLPPGAVATIRHGAVTFTVRSVSPARRLARRDWLDRAWPPYVALAALVLLTLVLLAFHTARPAETLERIPSLVPRFTAVFAIPSQPPDIRHRHSVPPLPGARAGWPESHDDAPGDFGKPHERTLPTGILTVAHRDDPGVPRHVEEHESLHTDDLLGPIRMPRGHFLGDWPYTRERRLPDGPDDSDVWGHRGSEIGEARGNFFHGLNLHTSGVGSWSLLGGHARLGAYDGGDRRTRLRVRHPYGTLRPLLQSEAARLVARKTRRCGPLGAARVHFTVDGFGRAHAVTIAAATPSNARAAACVAAKVRRTWFPSGLGSVRVTYPVAPSSRPPD